MPENDPGSGTTPAPKTQGDAESDPLRGSEAQELLVGYHACECGHPGMRLLPDGVFHCPACGSEVLPIEKPWIPRPRAADLLASGTLKENLIRTFD